MRLSRIDADATARHNIARPPFATNADAYGRPPAPDGRRAAAIIYAATSQKRA